jgi:hypothetical protein
MCPACIAVAAQAAIGATSAGAWTVLVIKKFLTKFPSNIVSQVIIARRLDHE